MLELNAFILWFLVFLSRKKIAILYREVEKLSEDFEVKPSRKFSTICLICFIIITVTFPVGFCYPYDAPKFKKYHRAAAFGIPYLSDNEYLKWFFIISYGVYITFVYVFPYCVCMLYVTFCKNLETLVRVHVQKNTACVCFRDHHLAVGFQSCFDRYFYLQEGLRSLEDVLSFPVFLIISCTVLGMFYGCTKVFSEDTGILYSGRFFIPLNCFLSFTLISVFASRVNEADILARRSNSRLLQRLPSTTGDAYGIWVKFLDLNSGSGFTLTGWGIFNFTKSSYLTTLGTILTYALLIINIDK